MPLALFSNSVGNETKKANANTVLKYPKTDFRIGKARTTKIYEDSSLQGSSIMNRGYVFDQPVTRIEPTFFRIDSVVY